MKIRNLFFLILFTSYNVFGQDCDCLKNMTLLQLKIEENQASYQHQVVEPTDSMNMLRLKVA